MPPRQAQGPSVRNTAVPSDAPSTGSGRIGQEHSCPERCPFDSSLRRDCSARLIVKEAERDCREKRRGAKVVVGESRQDRECVTTFGSALAHPATVAKATIKQLEHLD